MLLLLVIPISFLISKHGCSVSRYLFTEQKNMFDFFEDPMRLVKCKLPLKRNLGRPLSYFGVTTNVLTL